MQPVNPSVRRWRQDATDNPDQFWARAAKQLPWLRPWDQVFVWERPTFRWFIGGQTNLAYNALDHHVERGWGGHTALIAFNERGERRLYTYAMLLHEVERVAAALRGMGIQKGDRLTIYMPTCPEAIMLMLATVRIGAIHSVVFAGFGSGALADRVKASGSRLVFTADITYRKGKDGYVWFAGRADEIIKIAAHRIGTIEVETAFLKHPAVAEAGVTGRPDELRGEIISAFVVLRQSYAPTPELRQELLNTVRQELGAVAVIGEVEFVNMLPKTRSGKIMRRVLKAVTLGKDPGDITTIEDESSVEEARHAWEQLRSEVSSSQ